MKEKHGASCLFPFKFYHLRRRSLKTLLGVSKPLNRRHTKKTSRSLSPIGRIKILTYLIWGFLGAAIFDCIIRSCDLFYWFIRTGLGPTVVPTAITSLELFCVLTMCYFSDNVSSYVAFTPTPIPPRFESWSLSWAGRGGPISSYQILSCLDVNLDNRVDRGKFFGCQKISPD